MRRTVAIFVAGLGIAAVASGCRPKSEGGAGGSASAAPSVAAPTSKPPTGASPTATEAPPAMPVARTYQPPARDLLMQIAKKDLNLPGPASLGAPVRVTVREPVAADAAYLFLWAGDIFDPAAETNGLAGAAIYPSRKPQFGLYIKPKEGSATLVDCDIPGVDRMVYTVQALNAAGEYVAELPLTGTMTNAATGHWTVALPWQSQFVSGIFRVLLIAQSGPVPNPHIGAAPFAWLSGCEISPVS